MIKYKCLSTTKIQGYHSCVIPNLKASLNLKYIYFLEKSGTNLQIINLRNKKVMK